MVRRTSIEEFLIDSYKGNEANSVRPIFECQDGDLLEASLDDMESTARHIYMQDKDANPLEIDWDYVFQNTMPDEVREGLMADVDERSPSGRDIFESTANSIKASQWGKFFDRCITTTFAEIMCRPADFMLRPLFQRVDMPCAEYNIRQQCEIVVPRIKANYDIEHDAGEMPTMWVNLGDRRCIRFPRLGTSRLGFALHRSLVCMNATEAVRNLLTRTILDNLGWDDELMQYRILFGTDGDVDKDGSPTCGNPFWMDGEEKDGYRTAASDLWRNKYAGTDLLLQPGNYRSLCTIERLWEAARDPHTGRPNACPGDFQVLFTSLCEAGLYRTLITGGQQRVMAPDEGEVDAGGTATEWIRPLTARAGWSSSVAFSPYIIDELKQWYLNIQAVVQPLDYIDITDGQAKSQTTAPTASIAETWARQTYVVSKSFPDAVGWGIDFDITSWDLEGTNQQIFLDRGITFQRVYEYKRAPLWQRPWLNILVHAFDPTVVT